MLESIDHVNIVVLDLESMVGFYRDLLKLKMSKLVTIRGAWIDAVVGLEGTEADVVYLEAPEGPRIELIRYRHPEAPRPGALEVPNTPGLRHLAFRIDDIDEAVTRLRRAGVRFFSDVAQVPDEPVTYAGGIRKRLVYFQDPEGNLLELCEYR